MARTNLRCRAVRERDPRAGERYLHHMPGEVARGMQHVLMRGRDAARRRVVVRAEMRGDDSAAPLGDDPRQRDRAVRREDRLRRFDHHLEAKRPFRELAPVFEGVARRGERRNLFGCRDLGEHHDEIVGQLSAGFFEEAGEE